MTFTIAEYIWIDGSLPQNLRSKMRTLYFDEPITLASFPEWNFDGSSTNQAIGSNSEVILKPQALFKNPLNSPSHYLILCDCYDGDLNKHITNHRDTANNICNQYHHKKCWFGLEQEYFLVDPTTQRPLGYPVKGNPKKKQGDYYCGVGVDNAFGRVVAEEHYLACLRAGIKMSGINGEVAPGQWEFQVGPCEGIEAGDHLWMARRIGSYLCSNAQIRRHSPQTFGDVWNE